MYLGIDLGTSEVKVLLLDTHHQVLAVAGEALTLSRPRPHWSEQNPADWWRATGAAVAAVRAQAPQAFAAVRAIGLSGQMHGATLLDASDRVLRPAILCVGATRSRRYIRLRHPSFVKPWLDAAPAHM